MIHASRQLGTMFMGLNDTHLTLPVDQLILSQKSGQSIKFKRKDHKTDIISYSSSIASEKVSRVRRALTYHDSLISNPFGYGYWAFCGNLTTTIQIPFMKYR